MLNLLTSNQLANLSLQYPCADRPGPMDHPSLCLHTCHDRRKVHRRESDMEVTSVLDSPTNTASLAAASSSSKAAVGCTMVMKQITSPNHLRTPTTVLIPLKTINQATISPHHNLELRRTQLFNSTYTTTTSTVMETRIPKSSSSL